MDKPPRNRQSWAEIDLGALAFNIAQLKSRLRRPTRFMAVVKADAYGHGAVAVARAAAAEGVDWFGVATVPEAIELRAAGIEQPILLLSQPPVSALERLIELDLTPAAADPEFIYQLAGAAQLQGKKVDYHLKVNTGMNRLGVRPEDVGALMDELAGLPHVRMTGVFTQLATAEVAGSPDAQAALRRFENAVAAIRAAGCDPGIVHAANSAGTILREEAHFDMVRCGIALYGLHPGEATRAYITLKPVMSVYSQAEQVHPISAGEGVSYGLTWHADIGCAIVTLPIGYADGVPRNASGKLEFLHDGRRFEQVGWVTMDQTMVRAMKNDPIKAGDTFVMIGEDGGASIPMDEVAQKAGTISYDIACGLGRRLERVYLPAEGTR